MTREQTKAHLERVLKKLGEPIYCAVTAAELVQVMIDELSTKKTATDLFVGSIDSASEPGDTEQNTIEFIMTSKNKMLKDADLKKFNQFWNAFDYKKSRAEAAQAWMDIPDTKDEAFMAHVLYAACQTAFDRKPAVTPKMAQGWLSARRWEDYEPSKAPKSADQWTLKDWHERLTSDAGGYMRMSKTWANMPGPNPWDQVNLEIPQDVRDKYAERWGWK